MWLLDHKHLGRDIYAPEWNELISVFEKLSNNKITVSEMT